MTAGLLSDRHRQADARQAIDRAEALVREAGAEDLTLGSDLLPSGLTRRFRHLAEPLSRDPVRRRSEIESAWLAVDAHALGPGDPRTEPFHAAVRLARWLAAETDTRGPSGNLAALAQRQVEVDGWVDSAVNDAAAGVDDPELGLALAAVLDAARQVRDRHDLEFATALARGTADGVRRRASATWRTTAGEPTCWSGCCPTWCCRWPGRSRRYCCWCSTD